MQVDFRAHHFRDFDLAGEACVFHLDVDRSDTDDRFDFWLFVFFQGLLVLFTEKDVFSLNSDIVVTVLYAERNMVEEVDLRRADEIHR